MAAGYTPRLGQGSFEVCPNCQHTDCRTTRALIATECRWCHQPLGEQARFYFVPDSDGGQTAAHANCEEDRPS